jgi:hypothetical protein
MPATPTAFLFVQDDAALALHRYQMNGDSWHPFRARENCDEEW